LESLRELFVQIRWQDLLDIVLVFVIIYRVLLLIRGTRAVQILLGLAIVAVVFFLSDRMGLFALHYLLRQFFEFLFLIIVILFQDEIRRGLATIGKNPFVQKNVDQEAVPHMITELCKAVNFLSAKRVGSLIVIERQVGLKNYIERSIKLNARISSELLISIFNDQSPIHDGAVILQDDQILAAGCFFPINPEVKVERLLGTRHLAALSVSHECDALVIVTSEERGEISFLSGGQMERDISLQDLRTRLKEVYGEGPEKAKEGQL